MMPPPEQEIPGEPEPVPQVSTTLTLPSEVPTAIPQPMTPITHLEIPTIQPPPIQPAQLAPMEKMKLAMKERKKKREIPKPTKPKSAIVKEIPRQPIEIRKKRIPVLLIVAILGITTLGGVYIWKKKKTKKKP